MKDIDIRGFFKTNEIKQKKSLNTNTTPDVKSIKLNDTPKNTTSEKKRKIPNE